MKTVLALIVAATLGISSVAMAADTVAPPAAPAAHSAPAKTMHHKKAKKTDSMKKMDKTAPVQKAQAAKKHHKKAAHSKSAPAVMPVTK